jgi:hypothetical protein
LKINVYESLVNQTLKYQYLMFAQAQKKEELGASIANLEDLL